MALAATHKEEMIALGLVDVAVSEYGLIRHSIHKHPGRSANDRLITHVDISNAVTSANSSPK